MTSKTYIIKLIIFFLINFGALALGSYLQGKGSFQGWYAELNKAPWTPPGWVFGAAWFSIMICFSFYMTTLSSIGKKEVLFLFALQFILNVAWNPLFFKYHLVTISLVVIASLTLLVWFFLIYYWKDVKMLSLLVLPYGIWLLIATSLNAYILVNNP
jgi:benzodiazapine receptor